MRKILLSVIAMTAVQAFAAEAVFEIGGNTYTVIGEKTVELTQGDKTAVDVEIQDEVIYDGVTYAVTSIAPKAFQWGKCQSVVIPASVKVIGTDAFEYCDVTSVTLNEGLEEISDYAFPSHKITELEIPSTVKTIGESAFFGNSSNPTLQKLTLHEGLKKIGKSAFYGNAIQELVIPASVDSIMGKAFLFSSKLENLTFNEGLVYIGEGAFNNAATVIASRNTTLKEVTFPSTLTEIGKEAFFKMPLESLTIPASLSVLGDCAFAESKITTITVAAGNKNFKIKDNMLYSNNLSVLYLAPVTGVTDVKVANGCLGVAGGAFWGTELKSITLPAGLRAIGYGAFYNTAISSITFPESVTYIDDEAFAFTKLTDLVLPENLECVYSATFFNCKDLKTITIPSGVQGIDSRAFYGCNNIQTVTCKSSTPCKLVDCYEGEEIFTTGFKLIVPKGCKEAYKSTENKYYRLTLGSYDNNFPTYYSTIQESEQGILTVESSSPANEDAFGYAVNAVVTVTFTENIQLTGKEPKVYFRPNYLAYPSVLDPSDCGAVVETGSTLRVWVNDLDGYADYFTPDADKLYFIVVPEGLVRNEAGDENEQIIIWTYGSKELKQYVEETLDIEEVAFSNTDSKEAARYSIDGQRLSAPQQGINIVKYADGTTRKAFVK